MTPLEEAAYELYLKENSWWLASLNGLPAFVVMYWQQIPPDWKKELILKVVALQIMEIQNKGLLPSQN